MLLDEYLGYINVPEKYRKSLDSTIAHHKQFQFDLTACVASFRAHMEKREPYNMILLGCNGSGKTTLACSFLVEAISKYHVHSYRADAAVIISEYLQNGRFPNKYAQVDFLVIDELGKEPKSSMSARLEQLIRWRVDARKTTCLVTNLKSQELPGIYGPGFVSQLLEEFVKIQFSEVDNRLLAPRKEIYRG